MEREEMFMRWLQKWQPKNATVNFNKNLWAETTLLAYSSVLKNIVDDLKIDNQHIKKNLFEYSDARKYLIAYREIISHENFKSLKYFPIAKKSLNRYLDFLSGSK
jgi:predicted restriction endonuclease